MFIKEDTTYNDIRKKSLEQWLCEMEQHEDVAVRGGVKLTRDYIEHLQKEIERLQEANALKSEYLKKISKKESVEKRNCREPEIPDCGCIYG